MAEIVLGLATSHSPQVSQGTQWWPDQADLDRNRTPYEALEAERAQSLADELRPEVWAAKHAAVQRALATLADALASARPDIVVVIGDDQEELFLQDCMPTFTVFWGEQVWDLPEHVHADMSVPSRQASRWAFHGDVPEAYPCSPALGRHVVSHLMKEEFDVAQFTQQHPERSLGHAFTFVRRRLMADDRIVPILPILINTYIPPNQPSAARCYKFGEALRRAIEAYPENKRVAVVASGGLSHFVIDAALDRRVLEGLAADDRDSLSSIPSEQLQAGSSEILNWIAAGGALRGMRMKLVDYVPGYRSLAGTGVGMAFALWT